LTDVLAHPEGSERALLRAQVLTSAGYLFALLSDYVAAQATFAESMAICESLGDTHERAGVLNRLGWLAREQGDAALARARVMESPELYWELGEGAFSAAWAAGQALLLESAIAEALAGTKQRPADD